MIYHTKILFLFIFLVGISIFYLISAESFFISNPEIRSYKVEIDNGLKISYGSDYSITFVPYFVLNNGNVLTWNEIPANIEKDLWKVKMEENYYKYGVNFGNITTAQKNSIKYVVLHRSTSMGLTWDDVRLSGNSIIIKDKVIISHDDLLSTYTIPVINKTDIVISGLDNNWTECLEYNETDCINPITVFNWKDNKDGTWNISFDPTIFIAGGVTVTVNSPLNNSNFNISSVNFNITSNNTLSWCGVSINNGLNITMSNTSGTAFNYTNSSIADGNYNFIVSCNDTANNYGNSGLNYFLVDTIFPQINFTPPTPANGSSQAQNSIFVNVSASDLNNISTFIDFDNSLVGWWRMDDINQTGLGSLVYDKSAYGNNGTAYGNAVQTSAGKLGKGFNFDGDGDYVDAGNDASLDFNTTFTISAWVSSKGGIWERVVSKGGQTAVMGGFELVTGNVENKFIFRISNTTNFPWMETTNTYALNTWHHVVGQWNGTAMLIYVDGVFDKSQAQATYSNSSSYSLKIGRNPVESFKYFNGTIDDVMIFNRSLSADEITALYANQSNRYLTNNFTSLSEGIHTFKAYTQDIAGNVNVSDIYTFTVPATPSQESALAAGGAAGHQGGTGLGSFNLTQIKEMTSTIAGYPCPTDTPFFKRLVSTCKVHNNDICDDGEWFLLNFDCAFDELMFYQMWFIRIVLFLSLVMLIRNSSYFPFAAGFVVLLLYINHVLF